MTKLTSLMDDPSRPLHESVGALSSTRLLRPQWREEHDIPSATRPHHLLIGPVSHFIAGNTRRDHRRTGGGH